MANCRYCGLTNAIRDNTCIHCGTRFGGVAPEHRGSQIAGRPRTYAEWRQYLGTFPRNGEEIHHAHGTSRVIRETEPVGAK
jgi:hypothetical protein